MLKRLLLLISISQSLNYNNKCKYNVTIDLSNSTIDNYNSALIQDNVTYPLSETYRIKKKIYGCPCNVKTCLRKCCELNEVRFNNTCVPRDGGGGALSINLHDGINYVDRKLVNVINYYLLDKVFCRGRTYSLDPKRRESDAFFIQNDGQLFLPYAKLINYVKPIDYCVDSLETNDDDNEFYIKVCSTLTDDVKTQRILYVIGEMNEKIVYAVKALYFFIIQLANTKYEACVILVEIVCLKFQRA